MILSDLGRVSLAAANRSVVNSMPVLRVGLSEMRLDLGMIGRPEVAHKASMCEKASRRLSGQIADLMPGESSYVLTKLMQLNYVRVRASGVLIFQVP